MYLATKSIEWKFDPPISLWIGGTWKSLVKFIKRFLIIINREKLFAEECLLTFFLCGGINIASDTIETCK